MSRDPLDHEPECKCLSLHVSIELTWVILARSREGRCSWASSGLLRFMAVFLSFSTQGWDLLRERHLVAPGLWLARLPSSGVESGELASDASSTWCSGRLICSWERERGLRKAWRWEWGWWVEGEIGHTGEAVNWGYGGRRLKNVRSRDPSEDMLEREGKLKLELRCMMGNCPLEKPPPPLTLPPLWHLRFSTVVHTLEPWGFQDERKPLNSSENERERHWRLLGGAVGAWLGGVGL